MIRAFWIMRLKVRASVVRHRKKQRITPCIHTSSLWLCPAILGSNQLPYRRAPVWGCKYTRMSITGFLSLRSRANDLYLRVQGYVTSSWWRMLEFRGLLGLHMLAECPRIRRSSPRTFIEIFSIELDPQNMADSSDWELGIEGNFPLHKAVVAVIPSGTKVVSSESCGVSAWTKTAKVSVILPDGSPKRYFLKVRLGSL
jgi:hypothetical protein